MNIIDTKSPLFRPQFQVGLYPILVVISFTFTMLQAGPLNQSWVALILTVLFQLYLPGWLLIRVLGRQRSAHPLSRFAWTLAGGLGLTISLAGLCRLLWMTIPVYLVGLHLVMFVLAWVRPRSNLNETSWKLTRRSLPLYVIVVVACITNLGVSAVSWERFIGYEDQAIFVSLADWLAHNPGEYPHNLPLRTRQIGVLRGDTRLDSDGWTYIHGAWVWTSGVPAAQIIWFDLNALFVWVGPLIIFALAYELTRREKVGAWSAGALTLVGLLTVENLVYHPSYAAFGRFAVFQTNTLRQFALTIMLPLTLQAGLVYLRDWRRMDLILVLLTGLALALLHPFVITLYLIGLTGGAGLTWLAQPTWARLRTLLPLALVVVLILVVPFMQRYTRYGFSPSSDNLAPTTETEPAESGMLSGAAFLSVRNFPLVGTTFIRNPASVFYHPVILITAVLGLAAGVAWRRSLAARYIFASTAALFVISFTPGITELFNKIVASAGLLILIFILPVPLILGLSFDVFLSALARFNPVRRYGLTLSAAAFLVVVGLLLLEPFPIPASARDQLHAYSQAQSPRYMNAAQRELITALPDLLPKTSVVIAPRDVSNLVIEDVSGTLIIGGRESRNTAAAGDNRFFTRSTPPAPWLDTLDLAFLKQFGVTHIILEADDTRLTQLRLQPERFEILGTPAGYTVFKVLPDIQTDERNALFAQMNTLYGQMSAPRWGRDGFALAKSGDASWQDVVTEWEKYLAAQPDDISRFGLAFSYLMLGDDQAALPLLATLQEHYPQMVLLTDALAYTLRESGSPEAAAALLQENLTSDSVPARVLAARTLLTGDFAYLLDANDLAQVIEVSQANPIIWEQLIAFDQPDVVRTQVALLMNASQWQTAAAWLDRLPEISWSPQDVVAAAALALVQGDTERALATLKMATDPDWVAAKAKLHPDRWENNTAAQSYYLLNGAVAQRASSLAEAEANYQEAINRGAEVAGTYFLEQLISAKTDTTTPEMESLLAIADNQSLYLMHPQVSYQTEDESHLTITATYGSPQPRNAFPVRSWFAQIVSPDATEQYGAMTVSAEFVDGALVRVPIEIPLNLQKIPLLTPAVAVLQARYNEAIVSGQMAVPVVLNRPVSASIPAAALPVNRRFGEHITLLSYVYQPESDQREITLYWQTDAPLEDYQVFVHVVDDKGQIVAQRDSQPVAGSYPTNFWRTETVIADTYTFTDPLPAGNYTVRLGLYRLSDQTRLQITPADDQVQNDGLRLLEFQS